MLLKPKILAEILKLNLSKDPEFEFKLKIFLSRIKFLDILDDNIKNWNIDNNLKIITIKTNDNIEFNININNLEFDEYILIYRLVTLKYNDIFIYDIDVNDNYENIKNY